MNAMQYKNNKYQSKISIDFRVKKKQLKEIINPCSLALHNQIWIPLMKPPTELNEKCLKSCVSYYSPSFTLVGQQ